MIKKILLISTVCFSLTAQASHLDTHESDSLTNLVSKDSEHWLQELEPTYLRNVTLASKFTDNWFVGISGGVSAFAGSPLGCEDLFGRIKPMMNLHVGKWFTPVVGARIAFQGFELKNSDLSNNGYKSFHADLLLNVANYFNKARDQPRWDVVPYAGLGLIHNEDIRNNPFALSYGVMGRYRLSQRLHLTMELGGTTTFKNFDGHGDSQQFGDNLVGITAGLSVTLGRSGWKKIVYARPYMTQNDWLLEYSRNLANQNRLLVARHKQDVNVLEEMRKILDIEGLLDIYGDKLKGLSMGDGESQTPRIYPKNDYSGLNSLMDRLRNGKWKKDRTDGRSATHVGDKDSKRAMAGDSVVDPTEPSDEKMWNDYLLAMGRSRECIGSPIYFFFKIDTNVLTDHRQLINLDEIARIAKKYDLRIRVTGAADSATGTNSRNELLSLNRAKHIREQLIKRGLNEKYIAQVSVGGVSEFSPIEGNRNTKVELFFEPNE